MAHPRFGDIAACVFDAYGTLFDYNAAAGRHVAALGEKAAPLIAEWRRVRAGHLDERQSRVEQATDWVRMCELELALIGEHGLTLPPDSYPWDRFQRRDALRRRELWLGYALAERRWALAWRLLRRLLTFGWWRR